MRVTNLALGVLVPALPLAFAADAEPVSGNSPGTQYVAILPDKTDTTVRGAIQVASNSNSTGVDVQISMTGFPSEGGPFSNHMSESRERDESVNRRNL